MFGAASLTNVLEELGPVYTQRDRSVREVLVRGELGAGAPARGRRPADVFVSADLEWMDYVQARGLIDRTRGATCSATGSC